MTLYLPTPRMAQYISTVCCSLLLIEEEKEGH